MSDVPRSLQSWVSTIPTVVITADVFQRFMKYVSTLSGKAKSGLLLRVQQRRTGVPISYRVDIATCYPHFGIVARLQNCRRIFLFDRVIMFWVRKKVPGTKDTNTTMRLVHTTGEPTWYVRVLVYARPKNEICRTPLQYPVGENYSSINTSMRAEESCRDTSALQQNAV